MASYRELIEKRVSVRTYDKQNLDEDVKKTIHSIISAPRKGPFGGSVRFSLVTIAEKDREQAKKLGTYGFINGAQAFIVGAAADGAYAMEDFGYCMEEIILKLTALGLGTCWLGGTFNRGGFSEAVHLRENEIMPAATPVGYPAHKERFIGRFIRGAAGSAKRKPWSSLFFDLREDDLVPLAPADVDKTAAAVLEAVRLSPSASNKQPWRILRDKAAGVWHFFLQRTPGYSRLVKEVSLQNIDMGIAMCHFELAAGDVGMSGTWRTSALKKMFPGMEYIVTFQN